jgi:hypothetical protein
VYNSEKPEFGVVADHHSSDVVITEEKDFFEIECKGTDASILSRSTPIRLRVTAAVPTDTDDTLITIKTNHFLSLLAHVSVLLASGGFSVKKLCEWLRAAGRRKQTAHNSNNIRNQDSLQ